MRTVSISSTVRNAFSDRPDIGAKKFPAAPREKKISANDLANKKSIPQMTKSIRPNFSIVFATAS